MNAEAAEALGLQEFRVEGLRERGILTEEDGYLRFEKKAAGKERGTVYFEGTGEVVGGFPKIRRFLVLDPSVPEHFDETVVVEEKMNGYNVRIADIGEVVALTRGGPICPYTTHWARRIVGGSFFEENPGLVICGEMVGPDNPYVTSEAYDADSVDFFVFDVREKGSNRPLPVDERRDLVERHGLRGVEELARIDPSDTGALEEEVRGMHDRGGEGVVLKDPAMDLEPVKYTTSLGNCEDLRYAFRYFQEYGGDFMYPRAVREGFQAVEFGGDLGERAERLGRSILEPLKETVEGVEEGGRVVEPVSIRVFDLSVAAEFEEYLRSRGVDAVFHEPEDLGDGSFRVEVDRIHQGTEDKTRDLLEGGYW